MKAGDINRYKNRSAKNNTNTILYKVKNNPSLLLFSTCLTIVFDL